MTDLRTDVLIVGGGLTASMLLSRLGMDSLLVSSLPSTSVLPKAHVLHQRTMEIRADLGIADVIYQRGTPPEHMRYSGWYAGLTGPDPHLPAVGWARSTPAARLARRPGRQSPVRPRPARGRAIPAHRRGAGPELVRGGRQAERRLAR